MKKRLIAFVLFVLPLLYSAYADSAHIDITNAATNEALISPLGQAQFTIEVANTRPLEDNFFLELSDVAWSLSAARTPDVTTGIDLGGFDSRNTTIFIKPDPNIAPGTYYVQLKIRSQDTKQYSTDVFIITVDPKVVDYKNLRISASVLGSTSIDPAKTNSIKILLNNSYPVYLSNLTINAKSKFLNEENTFDMPPKSEKIIEFSLNIDSSTPQQEDPLDISVAQGSTQLADVQTTLLIKEYKLPYKIDVVTSQKFLYTVEQITFTNTEAATKTQDASLLMPSSLGMMVITQPAAQTQTFNGQEYLVWSGISLAPEQTYQVVVIEDYRQISAIILAVLLIIFSYYAFRSPIIIKKKAYAIHAKDTGNNELKVMLYIKNRTGRTIQKVRVLDRLPMIHSVEEDFGPGTPEPRYRKHEREGVILDWDIALAPKEERIFTYKIKSALPIVGDFTLKPCVVQYGDSNKRVSSDSYRLVIDK